MLPLLLMCMPFFRACGLSSLSVLPPAPQQEPKAVVRDSVGVTVVSYASVRASQRKLAITTRPFRDIGGLLGATELDEVQPMLAATELANGTLVINEFAQLKFVSPQGRLIRTVGRRGSGPGEFSQTSHVCRLRGDSLLVFDFSDGRVSLWNSAGRHVRSFARPGRVLPDACLPNGTFVVRAASSLKGVSGLEYRLVLADGTVLRRLANVPPLQIRFPLVWSHAVLLTPRQFIWGDARSLELQFRSHDGRVERILRVAEPALSISVAEWAQVLERTVPRGASPSDRRRLLAPPKGQSPPTRYPAFSTVRRDEQGRLWVGDYDNSRRWTVFDSLGFLVGKAELPWPDTNGVTSLAGFGRDYIIVRRRDADGAVHLSFHRFATPS